MVDELTRGRKRIVFLLLYYQPKGDTRHHSCKYRSHSNLVIVSCLSPASGTPAIVFYGQCYDRWGKFIDALAVFGTIVDADGPYHLELVCTINK